MQYYFNSLHSTIQLFNITRILCILLDLNNAQKCFGIFNVYTWMQVKVAQSCPTLCNPMDYTVHGILQARILEWIAFPFSRGSSQPRDQTQVSLFASREPQGKPKNIGVGSISLFQWIFLTQESNWGLLHCSWILYQLSYQRSPYTWMSIPKNKYFVRLKCSRQTNQFPNEILQTKTQL